MKSDAPFLEHILESTGAIEANVAPGREAFMSERMIQDAVIRNFEIIGEAATRLSPGTVEAGSIPLRRLIAFRNRLIHGYWSVDLILVWDVIANELQELRAEVQRLFARN